MKLIEASKQQITTLETIKTNIGKSVTFCGTIHRIRDMKEFSFVIIRTEETLIQCFLSKETELSMSANNISIKDGMSVEINGNVRAEERAQNKVEVEITAISVLSVPYDTMPIPLSKKYMGLSIDTDLPLRNISLRHPIKRAVFKIQAELSNGFSSYMSSQNFVRIHTPKICSSGAEGGANIFKLDYFDQTAFLTQSPQFYKQYMAGVFGKVFEVGNVYRAERHNTSRHLNEYVGLDFEMCFIKDMREVMEMEVGMLTYVCNHISNVCADELALLNIKMPTINSIPILTFAEAKQTMESKMGHKSKNKFDLDPIEEQILCDWAIKEYDSEFIFITHFPSKKRPFYAMDDKEDPTLALSFDLLFRGLEITTGGQRIHDYKEQVEKLERHGLDPNDFETFLNMHKYGMPPHGGLGLGLERLTMKLLNLDNIRHAALFPRDITRLTP